MKNFVFAALFAALGFSTFSIAHAEGETTVEEKKVKSDKCDGEDAAPSCPEGDKKEEKKD